MHIYNPLHWLFHVVVGIIVISIASVMEEAMCSYKILFRCLTQLTKIAWLAWLA